MFEKVTAKNSNISNFCSPPTISKCQQGRGQSNRYMYPVLSTSEGRKYSYMYKEYMIEIKMFVDVRDKIVLCTCKREHSEFAHFRKEPFHT